MQRSVLHWIPKPASGLDTFVKIMLNVIVRLAYRLPPRVGGHHAEPGQRLLPDIGVVRRNLNSLLSLDAIAGIHPILLHPTTTRRSLAFRAKSGNDGNSIFDRLDIEPKAEGSVHEGCASLLS